MAVLWRSTRSGCVSSKPLSEAAVSAVVFARSSRDDADGRESALRIMGFRTGTRRQFALLVDPRLAVFVSGQTVVGGMRVLSHRDEVIVGSQRFYFSAESTPVVERFTPSSLERSSRCPVCRGPLVEGQAVVRCPLCGRFFHQSEPSDEVPGKPCWTYASHCRFCQHPTALSGESVWRPDHDDALIAASGRQGKETFE